MEFFLKKWILLSSFVFATPGFANHISSRPNPTFAFAEALMWQISEANAGNWAQIVYPNSSNETIQLIGVPFKWSPGLRIGMGFNGKEKLWDVLFYYTGYKTQGRNQANTDTGELHSAFSSNFYANNPQGNGVTGPYYHQGEIQWDLVFNTFDIELGRQIKIDNLAEFRPFLGLKVGLINQTLHSTWLNPYPAKGAVSPTFTSATEKITNDFKGIGPSVGLNTAWHLYTRPAYTIKLIGNLSGAMLWSNWSFGDTYQNDAPETISTMNDDLSSAATMARAYLGIELSSDTQNAHWTLHVGYEDQVWFNQLQYYSFDMGKTNDALYLQGGVLGLGVHF